MRRCRSTLTLSVAIIISNKIPSIRVTRRVDRKQIGFVVVVVVGVVRARTQCSLLIELKLDATVAVCRLLPPSSSLSGSAPASTTALQPPDTGPATSTADSKATNAASTVLCLSNAASPASAKPLSISAFSATSPRGGSPEEQLIRGGRSHAHGSSAAAETPSRMQPNSPDCPPRTSSLQSTSSPGKKSPANKTVADDRKTEETVRPLCNAGAPGNNMAPVVSTSDRKAERSALGGRHSSISVCAEISPVKTRHTPAVSNSSELCQTFNKLGMSTPKKLQRQNSKGSQLNNNESFGKLLHSDSSSSCNKVSGSFDAADRSCDENVSDKTYTGGHVIETSVAPERDFVVNCLPPTRSVEYSSISPAEEKNPSRHVCSPSRDNDDRRISIDSASHHGQDGAMSDKRMTQERTRVSPRRNKPSSTVRRRELTIGEALGDDWGGRWNTRKTIEEGSGTSNRAGGRLGCIELGFSCKPRNNYNKTPTAAVAKHLLATGGSQVNINRHNVASSSVSSFSAAEEFVGGLDICLDPDCDVSTAYDHDHAWTAQASASDFVDVGAAVGFFSSDYDEVAYDRRDSLDIGDVHDEGLYDRKPSVSYVTPRPPPRRDSQVQPTVEPWQPSCRGLGGTPIGGGTSSYFIDLPMFDGADEHLPNGDLPLVDEHHLGVELPTLPLDVSRLHRIQGYEQAQYHRNSIAPLITPPVEDEETEQRRFAIRLPEDEISNVGYITEEEAQEALIQFVTKSCCYGKAAAKEMEIYRINPSCALHYTLETFMENRSTGWDQEPYTGQRIDGPSQGAAPLPWDIRCNPTQMFHSEVRFLEVPHTATVTCCHTCAAMGWTRCHGCMGRGFLRCLSCCGSGRLWRTDPRGHRQVESCWHCHGTGRKRCSYCGGDGRVVCKTCQGYRNLKCYIKLRVEYTNNLSEHIIENTDLPHDLIKSVTGEYVLEQTQPRIMPITDYPDDELCEASQNLLQQHLARARNARILIQRQKLRVVAVTECTFSWVNTEGRFWVYGKELAVYNPDYPQKHCWGCVVL